MIPPLAQIPFNARLIEAFAGTFLSPMYDNPVPTPEFHREGWRLYASAEPFCAIAAPRGHAKSTAFTHDFALASVLFRYEPHVLIVSATEELAMAHLGDIAKELRENDDIRAEFDIDKFLVDSKGEIVVRCKDGYEFRLIARGSGQKLRGMKWNGRRPGLILCDDMEEDEQVESADRRRKFSRWVTRALFPLGRKGAKLRWHGTIMHVDSMLAGLMKAESCRSLFYRAHAGFDDFTGILWPEMFDEAELRRRRQQYIDSGDPSGYSQEYLNNPLDNEDAYLRREWFLSMRDSDWESHKLVGVGVDFAISKQQKANRTSLTVGGKDTSNVINVFDQRVGRWDSHEIIEEMFDVQRTHRPDFWFVESGQIWLALWPTIKTEMLRRDCFLNIVTSTPIKDKATRGRAYQKRLRAGSMRFAKEAHWYPAYEDENLHFTGVSEATLDDQFDSTATLVNGFENLPDLDADDEVTEDEWALRAQDPRLEAGRNPVTGY